MSQGVAISPDGSIVHGVYDGYGCLSEYRGAVGIDPRTVWRRACWVRAGSPATYQGNSPAAPVQGVFFDEGDHDLAEPQP